MWKLVGTVLVLSLAQTWALPTDQDASLIPLITNGNDAVPGQFAHQASIVVRRPLLGDELRCSGSILNNRWILTTAQCAQTKALIGKVLVKAGQQKRDQDGDEVQTREIALVIIPSDAEIGVPLLIRKNDIGLIKLSKPLKLNKRVQPVKLPQKNCKPKGRALVSGFGAKSLTVVPQLPKTLQWANVTIISQDTCKDALRSISIINKDKLTDKQLCTGPLDGTVTACVGDSGNPLIQRNNKTEAIQIGILSWGALPCGKRGSPIVYTKVSSHVEWIKKRISEN